MGSGRLALAWAKPILTASSRHKVTMARLCNRKLNLFYKFQSHSLSIFPCCSRYIDSWLKS